MHNVFRNSFYSWQMSYFYYMHFWRFVNGFHANVNGNFFRRSLYWLRIPLLFCVKCGYAQGKVQFTRDYTG